MGADGSVQVLGSGAEAGSSVYFSLGYIGYRVGSEEGGLLVESPWPSSSLLDSSRCIRGYMKPSLSSESLSSVYVTTVPGGQ